MAHRPASTIPAITRAPIVRPNGKAVWHEVTPVRFSTPIPTANGPIRARAHREAREHNAVALDSCGTPQLPSQVPPKRA